MYSVIYILVVLLGLVFSDEYDHRYREHEVINLYVNKVGPLQNPQETYEYYHLPFCRPETIIETTEGLGEALSGFELQGSLYQINFLDNVETKQLCQVESSGVNIDIFTHAVENQYWFEFFFDDLPLWGLVGIVEKSNANYLYLHHQFTIEYNKDRVISIKVDEKRPVQLVEGANLTFTYGVEWKKSDTMFEYRFDRYLDEDFFKHNIHWYSLLNSTMLIFLLVGIVAIILTRSLNRDIEKHRKNDPDAELEGSKGWRSIQGDVFRPPAYLMLFSALIGIGAQLGTLAFSVIVMDIFIYHNNPFYRRGTMVTIIVLLYTLTSFVAGYVSGNYYKKNGGREWTRCLFLTAFIFPIFVSSIVLLLNFIALSYGSLAYIPFGTMIIVLLIWLFISIPLTLVGTLLGRHQGDVKNYGVITPFPNPIPPKKPVQQLWVHFLVGGILPFSVVSIEMYFVFTAFFESKFYYVFSFLLFVFIILVIVTVCVSIVSTYILLNSEDYRWQWTSFLSCASTSFYTFLYSFFYYVRMSKMSGFFQTSFYFGYIAIICFGFAIFLGTVSFLGSQMFVHKIYNVIHID